MEQPILDPIHAPCPDMAGCVNPDPSLTAKSRDMVANLKAKFFAKTEQSGREYIPSRFRFVRRAGV
ncbi:TPA: hypothetical protein ACOJPC_001519 [Vibrio fluvialis]|uniref:hypothetical protein n=1 Tax=Vibrio fluvialis TaxID=676 RepID=UPI001559045C|nr:hypothetical protein [Vibrio fluvialis]EKO3416112.1 hypothetical protein [Vibrio fluvialis]EKO3522174.1 hypothetical protein [Vibrio fluvialis]EKO3526501.1 hypothetical protein [Vibrio fluvialis]EKO3904907.1 hypothetical protein [Vibrio fluvialis]EKO3957000.1 hypothetical protein [Vibrio fluvialis]